jgi:hypothetical protein
MKVFNSFLCGLLTAMLMTVATGTTAVNAATHDFLASEDLVVRGSHAQRALQSTVDNVRDVFERYQPKLDSSTRIKKPLVVSGGRSTPRMQMTVEKCIAVVCRTVDLDFVVVVRERRGECTMNFIMDGDMSRSSDLLTDIYDRLHVDICFKGNSGGGILELTASARRSPSYKQDVLQKELLKMLRLQISPIVRAINATLRENGAESASRL